MPDLNFQIDVLLRVIGQIESASESRRDGDAPRPAGHTISGRWISTFYCHWFSLPLSIWLSSGSIGLFLYWQALSSAACLVEKFSRKQPPVFAAIAAGVTNAEYCPVEGAAR
jgi:hypothetical protein